MNYWKLGDQWGKQDNPTVLNNYPLLREKEIVICGGNNMKAGDYVAICQGFTVIALAVITAPPFPITDRNDLKTDFDKYKILYDKTNKIAPALIYELTNKEQFKYETQQGICQIHKLDTQNIINHLINKKRNDMNLQKIYDLLKIKKNIILQGAPGTGKTYVTAKIALSLIGEQIDYSNHYKVMETYQKYVDEGQIAFVTFHQSMDYEDFIEGLKPQILKNEQDNPNGINYIVEDGIFKKICKAAIENYSNSKKTLEQLNNDTMIKNIHTYLNELDIFERLYDSIIRDIKNGSITNYQFANSKNIPISWDKDRKRIVFREQAARTEKKENIKLLFEYFISNNISDVSSYNRDQWFKLISNLTAGNTKTIDYIEYGWIITELITRFNKNEYKDDLQNNHNEVTDAVMKKNYILIIDEINRGNISKIFGELITLLEADKRLDASHPITLQLPYSKEKFAVPPNMYIIGTMNTTDRSTGSIDYALRRRFAFITLKSDKHAIEDFYDNNISNKNNILKNKALEMFNKIETFIKEHKSELDFDDLMPGHSYFMATTEEELQQKIEYEVEPLLQEYYKDGLLLKSFNLNEAN